MILSARVRNAFRELAPTISLTQIEKLWAAEGFEHVDYVPVTAGQRHSLWEAYEASVDWNEPVQVTRVLRVFEVVLSDYIQRQGQYEHLVKILNRDGWNIDEQSRIVKIDSAKRQVITLPYLDQLKDSGGIEEVIHRLEILIDEDPPGVVGTSKELMEATAKTLLHELDIPFSSRDDFPKLVNKIQEALSLSPANVDADLDNSTSLRKVLSGLSQIAMGINEIRNYKGSGHGRHVGSKLSKRHARLCMNVSLTWCELILDTYFDFDAPWKTTTTSKS